MGLKGGINEELFQLQGEQLAKGGRRGILGGEFVSERGEAHTGLRRGTKKEMKEGGKSLS